MLDLNSLVLASPLLVEVRVPFELWIFLVICTGGIYLLVGIFPKAQRTHRSGSNRSEPDIVPMLIEVAAPVLSENEDDKLKPILVKHSLSEQQGVQLVMLTRLTLSEFFRIQEIGEGTPEKIRKELVSRGIPDSMAAQLVGAVVRLLRSQQNANGGGKAL
jgi:hypothetical protein